MQKTLLLRPEMLVMGLTVRANNSDKVSNIGALAGKYFAENIAAKIPGRKHSGVTLSAYTQYDSNEHGDYTYFIGEEVTALTTVEGLTGFVVPLGNYIKFTTEAGVMPEVVIKAWQEIWQMSVEDLGKARSYLFDYELYDQRAEDPQKTIADIYLGVQA